MQKDVMGYQYWFHLQPDYRQLLQSLKARAMDHSAYIDAAAATLGLNLTQEQRKGVALYFGLAASMAALVQGLPLTPADESGNVFVPVAPQVRRMNASQRRRHRRQRARRPRHAPPTACSRRCSASRPPTARSTPSPACSPSAR